MINVMIVDDQEGTREAISQMIELIDGIAVVGNAENGEDALRKLAILSPDLILMDINMPVMDGIEATERILRECPHIPVVIMSVQNDPEYIRTCMRSGARDYLFKPFETGDLERTIREVMSKEEQRRRTTTMAVLEDRFTHQSRVITFISAKSGVGTTTIAVNTAAALREQNRNVAFIDLDLLFGDANMFFGVNPSRTVVDLMNESSDLDADLISHYMTKHENGTYVLSAPKRPEEAETVNPTIVRNTVQALRKKFDYIVIDTGPLGQSSEDIFFTALDVADDVYMVSTRNLAVLKNNRLLLELLELIQKGPGQVRHIINRSDAKSGLKIRDVLRMLKIDGALEIGNDFQFVELSINEGIPYVLKDKQHRISKEIVNFSLSLEGEAGTRHLRRKTLKLFGTKR